MKITILKPQDFTNSAWAGGTTTQLFISPEGSNYADRNFDFRISKAKVEIEASEFTSLPGINRKLMIFEGEIKITHENQYTKVLKAFDQDSFKGEWKTSAKGICSDFNVMTTGNKQSDLFSLHLSANETSTIQIEKHWKTLLIYLFTGSCEFEINKEKYVLSEENLFVVNDLNVFDFLIKALGKCSLVVSLID